MWVGFLFRNSRWVCLSSPFASTLCAASSEGDFERFDDESFWQGTEEGFILFGEFDIEQFAAAITDEVAMFVEVGAVAGGFAIDMDGPDEAFFGKEFQAIVNSC